MSLSECLKPVIGLSKTECVCTEEGRPVGYNESLSGYYIDNREYGVPVNITGTPSDCQQNTWQILEEARCDGIESFITEYMIAMESNRKTTFSDISDFVGQRKDNSRQSRLGYDILGLRISPKVYKGASLCINEICLNVDISQEYDIHIVAEHDPETIIETITINAGGGGDVSIDTNIELPLSSKGSPIRYCIVYDRKGALPLNYKFDCGCSGTKKPEYKSQNLFEANGIMSDSLTAMKTKKIYCEFTGGMIINYTLKCKSTDWMCQVDEKFWCETSWGRVASKWMMCYANIALIHRLCNMSNVNFYTLVDAEYMYKKLEYLNGIVKEGMEWLAQRTPDNVSHCYYCNPNMGYQVEENLT